MWVFKMCHIYNSSVRNFFSGLLADCYGIYAVETTGVARFVSHSGQHYGILECGTSDGLNMGSYLHSRR